MTILVNDEKDVMVLENIVNIVRNNHEEFMYEDLEFTVGTPRTINIFGIDIYANSHKVFLFTTNPKILIDNKGKVK